MMSPSRNTPIAPQTISTGRLASTRPIPPGSGRQVGFWRRGSGQSTASATNETTSTIAAAHPNSHSGIGRSERTEIPCPIRNTERSPGFDYEGGDQRVTTGVLCHVALDLELALEVRLELKAGGLPRRNLLLDVVAVQVDVVGRFGAHDDHDRVALLGLDLRGPTGDLAPADPDASDLRCRWRGLLGWCALGPGLGTALSLGLRCRSGLRGLVVLVVAARARDHEGERRHDHGRGDQPDALVPRDAAQKYG